MSWAMIFITGIPGSWQLILWPKRAAQRLSKSFSEGAAELKMRIKTQSKNQTFACSLFFLIQDSLSSPYWIWSSVLPSKSGFGTPSMPADCTDCRLDSKRFLLPTYLAIDDDRTVDIVTQESGAKSVEILFWRSSRVTNGNAVML